MANDTVEFEGGALIESELEKHGSYASITRGTSMRPLFKTGRDMVIIKPISRPLQKYDVVLYTGTHNHYTMHRIIGVKEGYYVIRGDNTYRKEYVPADNIIGILTEFNRKGKHGSVEDRSFKIYSRIWHYLYPVRHILHMIRRVLSKIKHSIFKKK